MQQVTLDTLDAFVDRYSAARGGERNEDTASEAMFVASGKYAGTYILTTGTGPIWTGVQNATARSSSDGKGTPYPSVREAVRTMLISPGRYGKAEVFYSDDAEQRLRWLADRIARFKAEGGVLLIAEPK